MWEKFLVRGRSWQFRFTQFTGEYEAILHPPNCHFIGISLLSLLGPDEAVDDDETGAILMLLCRAFKHY